MPTPASIAAAIRHRGRPAVMRRVVAATVFTDAAVYVILKGATPVALVGSVQQSSHSIVVEAASLLDAGWPVPPRDNDRVVLDNRSYTVQGNAEQRYVGEAVASYLLQVRG